MVQHRPYLVLSLDQRFNWDSLFMRKIPTPWAKNKDSVQILYKEKKRKCKLTFENIAGKVYSIPSKNKSIKY